MKNYTSALPLLSAAHLVAGMPKDLVIILREGDVTAVGDAVNPSSVPTNFS